MSACPHLLTLCIHPTAKIHKNSVIGPNVSIGENCVVDEGVRIKESIILPGCKIESHTCIVNSIIGWDSKIGSWNHIEGVIEKVNPNMKHSIFESEQNVYFTEDGTVRSKIFAENYSENLQKLPNSGGRTNIFERTVL